MDVYIKYPNDIVIENKKIGGIICNSFSGADMTKTKVVIGFGINIDAAKPWASLADWVDPSKIDAELLLAKVLVELEEHIQLLEAEGWGLNISDRYNKLFLH